MINLQDWSMIYGWASPARINDLLEGKVLDMSKLRQAIDISLAVTRAIWKK